MPKCAEALIKTIAINASRERVFDFIVNPANMVQWIGLSAVIEPTPGGIVRIDPNGRDVIHGKVLEAVRPSRLVFTWGWERADTRVPAGSTIVEITLESIDCGTRLTLVHRDLPQDMRDNHDAGWTHYLGRLKIVAEGGDAGPDSFADPSVRHG
jgi:uncharacterized protein YndB with AHSA1/START domain